MTELRDKTIAKIEGTAGVAKIEGETPEGTFTLSRSDKGEWSFADGGQRDASAVETWSGRFRTQGHGLRRPAGPDDEL